MIETKNETYLVSGTHQPIGTFDPVNFQLELDVETSREAYITAINRHQRVRVVAIKMRCPQCGEHHIVVDPNLYLR